MSTPVVSIEDNRFQKLELLFGALRDNPQHHTLQDTLRHSMRQVERLHSLLDTEDSKTRFLSKSPDLRLLDMPLADILEQDSSPLNESDPLSIVTFDRLNIITLKNFLQHWHDSLQWLSWLNKISRKGLDYEVFLPDDLSEENVLESPGPNLRKEGHISGTRTVAYIRTPRVLVPIQISNPLLYLEEALPCWVGMLDHLRDKISHENPRWEFNLLLHPYNSSSSPSDLNCRGTPSHSSRSCTKQPIRVFAQLKESSLSQTLSLLKQSTQDLLGESSSFLEPAKAFPKNDSEFWNQINIQRSYYPNAGMPDDVVAHTFTYGSGRSI